MRYAATPRKARWKDLSKEHEAMRVELEKRLNGFLQGENQPPIAIVGAYGSGKSELMCLGYRLVWKQGAPAFMVNLEALLKKLEGSLTLGGFTDWLSEILANQVKELKRCLEEDDSPSEDLFLPDLGNKEKVRDYFGTMELSMDHIGKALDNGRPVLFVDEMEQHYNALIEKVPSDDRAPLREVLQSVAGGKVGYYLVISFGMTSAYEALSGAESRRRPFLYLPLPSPSDFADTLLESRAYANFIWWASRGRPGWALPLWDSWKPTIGEWRSKTIEELYGILSQPIEGLPAVNIGAAGGLRTSSLEILKRLLLSLMPISKSQDPECFNESSLDELGQHHFVLTAKDKIEVVELIDALTADLMELGREFSKKERRELIVEIKLRAYLRKVLFAISDDGEIAFGGWKSESEAFVRGVIAPLLTLLHDLILEYEGDTEEGSGIVDFLYHVGSAWGIFSDQLKDYYKVSMRFAKAKKFFQVCDGSNAQYVQASLNLVEQQFPRLVVKPVLRLFNEAEADIVKQRSKLEGSVGTSGKFFTALGEYEGLKMEFIFLPSSTLVETLQESFFQQIQREDYLPHEKVFVVLNLDQGLQEARLNPSKNSDLSILQSLGKVTIEAVKERRLSDFLTSLWYNANILALPEKELFTLLDRLLQNSKYVSKTSRRTLEHYGSLIEKSLKTVSQQIGARYLRKLREEFPYDDSEFPVDRIHTISERIREDRTVENILCSISAYHDRARTINTLFALRSLNASKELATGYKEFLNTYSVFKGKGGVAPSVSMRQVLRYVESRKCFPLLLEDILPRMLSIQHTLIWRSLTEDSTETPMNHMFRTLSIERKTLLKALSMATLITAHKGKLQSEIRLLEDALETTLNGFGKLTKDIDDFNKKVGRNIITNKTIHLLISELKSAIKILKGTSHFHPGILYVTYRFLRSVQETTQDKLDEWTGEKGLEGWKDCLDPILNLQEDVDGHKQRLVTLYQESNILKTNYFGGLEKVMNRDIVKPLKRAAQDVLLQLGTAPYELAEGVPKDRVDLGKFTEASESVRIKIDEFESQADSVDEAVASLDNLKNAILRFGKTLSGGEKDEA